MDGITSTFNAGRNSYLDDLSIIDTIIYKELVNNGGFENKTLDEYCPCSRSFRPSSTTTFAKHRDSYACDATIFTFPKINHSAKNRLIKQCAIYMTDKKQHKLGKEQIKVFSMIVIHIYVATFNILFKNFSIERCHIDISEYITYKFYRDRTKKVFSRIKYCVLTT